MAQIGVTPRRFQNVAAAIFIQKIVQPHAKPGMVTHHVEAGLPQAQAEDACLTGEAEPPGQRWNLLNGDQSSHANCPKNEQPGPGFTAVYPLPLPKNNHKRRWQPQKQATLAEGEQKGEEGGDENGRINPPPFAMNLFTA